MNTMYYHLIERLIPAGSEKGKTKTYASLNPKDQVTTDDLCQQASDLTTLSPGDMIAAIHALKHLLTKNLLNGKCVKLDGIGTFQLTIQSEGTDKAGDFNSRMIKGAKIMFRPSAKLKTNFTHLKYRRR